MIMKLVFAAFKDNLLHLNQLLFPSDHDSWFYAVYQYHNLNETL